MKLKICASLATPTNSLQNIASNFAPTVLVRRRHKVAGRASSTDTARQIIPLPTAGRLAWRHVALHAAGAAAPDTTPRPCGVRFTTPQPTTWRAARFPRFPRATRHSLGDIPDVPRRGPVYGAPAGGRGRPIRREGRLLKFKRQLHVGRCRLAHGETAGR